VRTVRFVLLAIAFTSCVSPATPSEPKGEPTPESPPIAAPSVGVVRIVDGDTIVVAIGGPRGTKVRLIGIDTPERNQCFYQAGTERMRALVAGKTVRLVKDVSETDRYGRLLRYVYAGAVFVNAVMVEEGFANAATYPPDVAHAADFVALARGARLAKRGLWAGGCAA